MGHARIRGSRGWVTARGHPAVSRMIVFFLWTEKMAVQSAGPCYRAAIWMRAARQSG